MRNEQKIKEIAKLQGVVISDIEAKEIYKKASIAFVNQILKEQTSIKK